MPYFPVQGVPEEREGLFDTIQRSKNHYQKRAYQCIKCMVTLFSNCRPAHQLLHTNGEIKRKWTLAVEWLQDELERVSCFVYWVIFKASECFFTLSSAQNTSPLKKFLDCLTLGHAVTIAYQINPLVPNDIFA